MKIKKMIRSGLKGAAAAGAGYGAFRLLGIAVDKMVPLPFLLPILGVAGASLMLGTQTFSDFVEGADLQREIKEEDD